MLMKWMWIVMLILSVATLFSFLSTCLDIACLKVCNCCLFCLGNCGYGVVLVFLSIARFTDVGEECAQPADAGEPGLTLVKYALNAIPVNENGYKGRMLEDTVTWGNLDSYTTCADDPTKCPAQATPAVVEDSKFLKNVIVTMWVLLCFHCCLNNASMCPGGKKDD